MGVYDILPNGVQVKCWKCEMRQLDIGSKVGKLSDKKNYIVLLRESGFIEIKNKRIVKISREKFIFNSHLPIFDKWANRINKESDLTGLIYSYEYYYDE